MNRLPLLLIAAAGALVSFWILRSSDGEFPASAGQGPDPGGRPVRILPGSAAAADWLAVLVPPERVVALPEQVARYSSLRLDPGPWEDHPRFASFSSEAIMAFDPDLVFVSPWTDQAMVQRVRDAGLNVVVLREPTTFEGLLGSCELVAEAVGEPEMGAAFAVELQRRRDALSASAPARAPRVLPYSNGGSGGFTAGAGTTLDLALGLAGAENAAAAAGIDGHGSLADENVLAMEFDALLVSGEDGESPTRSVLAAKDALADLPAIREGRFIQLHTALYASGSHTIMDAAERIARALRDPAQR